ncbi:MAG: DUF1311 domain-containing protein [Deltaproteobacteria bacterium]|nr:DUF1311 domain-containing protein [Deltaproteobacteria bacterium]
MKPWILLGVVVSMLMLVRSAGAEEPCSKLAGGSQRDQCVHQELFKADATLNQVYKTLMDSFAKDPSMTAKLKSAERAWIKWRDAYCQKISAKEQCLLHTTFIRVTALQNKTPGFLEAPPLFSAVRPLVCTKKKMDMVDTCGKADFEPTPVDLNHDGVMEWIYLGNGHFCGASMNCSFSLVQYNANRWRLILESGVRAVWPLQSSHQGYRNLLSSAHDTACETALTPYEWAGDRYKDGKEILCNFCEAEKGKQLSPLCHKELGTPIFNTEDLP